MLHLRTTTRRRRAGKLALRFCAVLLLRSDARSSCNFAESAAPSVRRAVSTSTQCWCKNRHATRQFPAAEAGQNPVGSSHVIAKIFLVLSPTRRIVAGRTTRAMQTALVHAALCCPCRHSGNWALPNSTAACRLWLSLATFDSANVSIALLVYSLFRALRE